MLLMFWRIQIYNKTSTSGLISGFKIFKEPYVVGCQLKALNELNVIFTFFVGEKGFITKITFFSCNLNLWYINWNDMILRTNVTVIYRSLINSFWLSYDNFCVLNWFLVSFSKYDIGNVWHLDIPKLSIYFHVSWKITHFRFGKNWLIQKQIVVSCYSCPEESKSVVKISTSGLTSGFKIFEKIYVVGCQWKAPNANNVIFNFFKVKSVL